MKYYPIQKNWRKIKQHIENREVQDVLVRDFNKFTMGRWGTPFVWGMTPFSFESCDWYRHHRGRRPLFWKYVKHSACHWLVNFNLKIATLVEPTREWSIITTQKHSCVWDGEETLFDFNFLALGVDAEEAFKLANGEHLKSGKQLKTYLAQDYRVE